MESVAFGGTARAFLPPEVRGTKNTRIGSPFRR